MRIDVEDVLYHQSLRYRWNYTDLDDIEFYKEGEKLIIPQEVLDWFEFTGLSNVDFITSGYINLTKEQIYDVT